jgi:XTP/dITP diphosphohydrolase
MKLLVASHNLHKVDEMRPHFANTPFELLTLADIHFKDEIEEFGSSFRMNSLIKAQAVRAKTGLAVFSDDSGIVVPALNGAPGIYSARYSGEGATDASNRAKLLRQLAEKGIENAAAYFVCVISFISDDVQFQVEGRCYGTISAKEIGKNGFGYDPIFISDEYAKSMAELPAEIKNSISHRGRALVKLIDRINTLNFV